MDTVKTYEQRQKEVAELLKNIDASEMKLPTDVMDILNKIDNFSVKDLLTDDLKVNKLQAKEITLKNGSKMYEIYSTGFALHPLKKAGSRTLACKLQLMLR